MMIDEVLIRLKSFGYESKEEDRQLIGYIISKVEYDVMNATNLSVVPECLKYEVINAVCAEFLNSALMNGKLENVAQIAKSIQEGDTTITFDNSLTPEARLLKCLNTLKLSRTAVVKYRVLTW